MAKTTGQRGLTVIYFSVRKRGYHGILAGSQIQGDIERINFIFCTLWIYQTFNSMQELYQIMLRVPHIQPFIGFKFVVAAKLCKKLPHQIRIKYHKKSVKSG